MRRWLSIKIEDKFPHDLYCGFIFDFSGRRFGIILSCRFLLFRSDFTIELMLASNLMHEPEFRHEIDLVEA